MDDLCHLKVLIVEDDQKHQDILLNSTAQLGCILTIAPTLKDTFKELKIAASLKIPFDLIILDIGLPDMQQDDPYIVIREVRTNPAYAHQSVSILLNTATPEQFKEGAFQAAQHNHIYTTHFAKVITDQELKTIMTSIVCQQ